MGRGERMAKQLQRVIIDAARAQARELVELRTQLRQLERRVQQLTKSRDAWRATARHHGVVFRNQLIEEASREAREDTQKTRR